MEKKHIFKMNKITKIDVQTAMYNINMRLSNLGYKPLMFKTYATQFNVAHNWLEFNGLEEIQLSEEKLLNVSFIGVGYHIIIFIKDKLE